MSVGRLGSWQTQGKEYGPYDVDDRMFMFEILWPNHDKDKVNELLGRGVIVCMIILRTCRLFVHDVDLWW